MSREISETGPSSGPHSSESFRSSWYHMHPAPDSTPSGETSVTMKGSGSTQIMDQVDFDSDATLTFNPWSPPHKDHIGHASKDILYEESFRQLGPSMSRDEAWDWGD